MQSTAIRTCTGFLCYLNSVWWVLYFFQAMADVLFVQKGYPRINCSEGRYPNVCMCGIQVPAVRGAVQFHGEHSGWLTSHELTVAY